MLIFLTIITVFPVIVALSLRGKYFKLVLILSLLNMVIAAVAYQAIIVPSSHCDDAARAAATSDYICQSPTTLFEIISVFNILFAVVIWYLAFKRSENSTQERLFKPLTASGWLIILSIVAVIAFFVYAFSAI